MKHIRLVLFVVVLITLGVLLFRCHHIASQPKSDVAKVNTVDTPKSSTEEVAVVTTSVTQKVVKVLYAHHLVTTTTIIEDDPVEDYTIKKLTVDKDATPEVKPPELPLSQHNM